MQRQHRPSRGRSRPTVEGIVAQHGTGPYCVKCRKWYSARDAVPVGRGRMRCPECGEPLERRRQGANGQPPEGAGPDNA